MQIHVHPRIYRIMAAALAIFWLFGCSPTLEKIRTTGTPVPTAQASATPTPTTVPPTSTPATPVVPPPTPVPPIDPIGLENTSGLRPVSRVGAGSLGRAVVSPDGHRIAAAGSMGLRLLDKFSLQVLSQRILPSGGVESIDWHPDGSAIASGSRDGSVRIWTIHPDGSLSQQALLTGHTAPVLAISWSPDGRWIASGGEDQSIRIWHTDNFSNPLNLFHSSAIYSLDWHPDSTRLLIGEFDGSISVTNGLTGENYTSFFSHSGWVKSAQWSPDGTTAVTGGLDKTLKIWDLNDAFSLEERLVIPVKFAINTVAWAPDGSAIVVGGGTPYDIQFFETLVPQDSDSGPTPFLTMSGHSAPIISLDFADGGVLISTAEDQSLRAWEIETGLELRRLSADTENGFSGAYTAVDLAPDGDQTAAGTTDGALHIRRNNDDSLSYRIPAHTGAVTSLDWSPGGNWIATGGNDNFTRIWDASTGELLQEMRSEGGTVNAVAFSSFGNLLASGGFSRILQIWQAGTEQQPTLIFPDLEITAVRWAASGTVLAVGGSDGSIKLYNGQTGVEISTLSKVHNTAIAAIRWEPLGGRLAAVDRRGTIAVWETSTGELLAERNGDGSIWRGMDWAPHGVLAAGRDDGTVLMLESDTLTPISLHAAHTAAVNDLVFSDDGHRLSTIGADGSLVHWVIAGISESASLLIEAVPAGRPGAIPKTHMPPPKVLLPENVTAIEQSALVTRGTISVYDGFGNYLAVGGGIGTWIYENENRTPLRFLPGKRTFAIAWSPDGNTMAARELQSVHTWDLRSGERLQSIPVGLGFRNALAWSPDGLMIAVGDRQGSVQIFNASSGMLVREWQFGEDIRDIVWQPNGRYLAAAAGSEIHYLDAAAEQQVALLTGHEGLVLRLAFHPFEPLLLSASDDQQIRLWDLTSISPPLPVTDGEAIDWPPVEADVIRIAEQEEVSGLAWSADGDRFYSAHGDQKIVEWGTATRQPQDVTLAGTEQTIVLLKSGITVTGISAGSGHLPAQVALQWLSSGDLFFLGDDQQLRRAVLPNILTNLDLTVLNLLPGREHFAWRIQAENIVITVIPVLQDTDSSSAGTSVELSPGVAGENPENWIAAVSSDGKRVAWNNTRSNPQSIEILDTNTGEVSTLAILDEEEENTGEPLVTALAWFSDSNRFAAGMRNGNINIWEANTRTLALRVRVYDQRVTAVALSPDNRRIAVAGVDETENGRPQVIRVLNAVNGSTIHNLKLDYAQSAVVLAFSPDGSLLASGASDGLIQLWDVRTGERLTELIGHSFAVTGLAFSPNGTALASTGRDGTVRVWGLRPEP